ncbi:glycerol-3-phosphate dehydrogenase subunit B [Desulfitispora alkaliphila]|uniref:anaerobic glycerol-3-phosphate dehydrogenase subunit GlpB n=1 Tax=Desulfitispora alkaliphila TaxID=622674 RepID=UPI003D2162D5
MKYEVIAIGAGMAGIIAACAARDKGKKVLVLSKGQGCTNMTSGTVDVLGYQPWEQQRCLTNIKDNVQRLIKKKADHPYSKIGYKFLEESLEYFLNTASEMGLEYKGDGKRNFLLVTSYGFVRPTALVPTSMAGGDVRNEGECLVIGMEGLLDFSPKMVADGANRFREKMGIKGKWVNGGLINLGLSRTKRSNPLAIAKWLDKEENFNYLVRELKLLISGHGMGKETAIVLPAVLGSKYQQDLTAKLSIKLQHPVFEIPVGQLTVPGYRLNNMLIDSAAKKGADIQLGTPVLEVKTTKETMTVTIDAPGKPVVYSCEKLILATGGVFGGGILKDRKGYEETAIGLPVATGGNKNTNSMGLLNREEQPYSLAGVAVNKDLQPSVLYKDFNKYGQVAIVGASLAGYDAAVEKSGLGVALATGYAAGTLAGYHYNQGERRCYNEASC